MSFDFFTAYLFTLREIAFILMVFLFIFGLDDLFIDGAYWIRKLYRKFRVYRKHPRLILDDLYSVNEKPLAIMVPAWQEAGVINTMADQAAARLDYENYHIFIGTYPNDPETQRDVDAACANHPHIHKVVCKLPGPTSKADCLNNIIYAIQSFENRAKFKFAGYILHDAEDSLSPAELRLFNYLLPRKDLIQLPVYPLADKWYKLTRGHYLDEFSEAHGKDVVMREAIAGQVPSAGVGTCFSRKAISALLNDSDGKAFNTRSLTEDYEIGFQLKKKGLKEIFVRFSALTPELKKKIKQKTGAKQKTQATVCVEEYFPDSFTSAIRQKSRWIVGIVFQGMSSLKWTSSFAQNYFIYRDRRGLIGHFVNLFAMLILVQLIAVNIYQYFVADHYRFLSVLGNSATVNFLVTANFFFLTSRAVHRCYFVTRFYGLFQGILSLPRMIWANIINFSATIRAIWLLSQAGSSAGVAWDKTDHEFPAEPPPQREYIGELLVRKGRLSETSLKQALRSGTEKMRLGEWLVENGSVSNEDLSEALALQCRLSFTDCDPFKLSPKLIQRLPADIALKYQIIPVGGNDDLLILGCNSPIRSMTREAISRKIKCRIECHMIPQGMVIVGLRLWYLGVTQENPEPLLQYEASAGNISSAQLKRIRDRYYIRQKSLGECLIALGYLEPAVLDQVRHTYMFNSNLRFGEFLQAEGVVNKNQIEDAYAYQKKLQLPFAQLINAEKVAV